MLILLKIENGIPPQINVHVCYGMASKRNLPSLVLLNK